MKISDNNKQIIYIFAFALIIRLAFSFLPVVPISDCRTYHELACSLSRGEGYSMNGKPTAYQMPGYSFVLSLFYRIFGENPIFGRFFNAVCGALTVLIIWKLVKIYIPHLNPVIPSFIMAVYAEHILFGNALVGEVFFAMLILVWLLVIRVTGRFSFVLSGFIVAIMTYIRPVAVPLALLPILWQPKNYKRYVFAFLVAFALLVPWMYRNHKKLGSPVLSTNFWVNLWIGNGSQADGGYFDTPDFDITDEVELERHYRNMLIMDISQNPLKPVVLLPIKLLHFGVPVFTAPKWGLADVIEFSPYAWWVILLSAINIVFVFLFILATFDRKLPWQFALLCIYFAVISMIFFGNDRFRFPILSIIVIIASMTLDKTFSKWREKCP